jgi:hypothetical protein
MNAENKNRDGDDVEVPDMLKHPLKDPDQPDVIGEVKPPTYAQVFEVHGAPHKTIESTNAKGLYFYGVVRARAWRGRERRRDGAVQRVRYRDLEALVKDTAFVMPSDSSREVDEHQRVVEMVMRRTTILPAPFGIVFRGRRPLIKVLQDQYLVLDEGLSLLEGHWELRLHIAQTNQGQVENELGDVAMNIYSELRRFARAAVTFPSEPKRIVSAAFLVDRTTWVEFVERIEDFGGQHPELALDVTGPWPPYDFVRIVV